MEFYKILFTASSSFQERLDVKNDVRLHEHFAMELPALTRKPANDHDAQKWYYSIDQVHLAFKSTSPDSSDISNIENTFDVTLFHEPHSSLPAAGNSSWTYSFKLNEGCKSRNAMSVANEIAQNEASTIAFAEPFIEPSFNVSTTNDTYYDDLWHIENRGSFKCLGQDPPGFGTADADCAIDDAWAEGYSGDGIKIAVIDKSIYLGNHPDLQNTYVNPRDYIDNDSDVTTSNFTDPRSRPHGQACAGLIAANGNNNKGVIGVAYDAKIIPITSYYGSAHLGLQYALKVDADIVNCSWAWYGNYKQAIINDLKKCKSNGRNGKGMVIVCSAGNENFNNDTLIEKSFPAIRPEVIAVIGSEPDDYKMSPDANKEGNYWGAWGSDYGSQMDVAAPCTHLKTTNLSLTTGYDEFVDYCDTSNFISNYTYFSGTSAAAPIVCGIAALMLDANPNLTSNQLQDALESTADEVRYNYGTNGKSQKLGHGRVNAFEAVKRATDIASISEINAANNRLIIYPNPTHASYMLNVKAHNMQIERLVVFDINGKVVINMRNIGDSENTIQVPLSGLKPGIYVLNVYDNEHYESQKFIIE